MVMVILVNRFDVTTIAAYGVVKNIENILFYPAMAMNMALITIVGQLYGAKCNDRIKDYMRTALIYGAVIEVVLTVLVLIFGTQISMAFVKESAVAAIVSHGLKITGIGYLCYMITSIFAAKMAELDKVNLSMVLMFIYYIVISTLGDSRHPNGHGRIEWLVGIVVSCSISLFHSIQLFF